MSAPLSLFVLAGEPSGDRIGADLVRRLRARIALELSGVGGEELAAEGLDPLYPMADLAVMGISDVLARLPRLLWRVEQTARAVLRRRPDIVVLIDAQLFSELVARRLRLAGHSGPVLLYVAPSVWARAPHRAARIKPLFDEILAVLPFEPAALARLGGPPASYVGHPALAEIARPGARDRGLVALLPGSREGEIRRHLPLMRAVAEALAGLPEVEGFVLPTLPALAPALSARLADWPVPVEIQPGRAERAARYETTLLAISAAGTATLELALAGVPMVLTYVMDPHQARGYEKLGRPPAGLANIALGRPFVPEFIQSRPDPAPVIAAATRLVHDSAARRAQSEGFAELTERMLSGDPGWPRHDPAERVLAHWRGSGLQPVQRDSIGT